MSASVKLLHHHFHVLHSFDSFRVKPTMIPASSGPIYYSQHSGICLSRFPFHPGSSCSSVISRSFLVGKCVPDSLSPELSSSYSSQPPQLLSDKEASVIAILKGANYFLPQVVIASTVLALIFPPSFKWFTNRYYAPALGFLMFAVGVNSSEKDFLEAFRRPKTILAGYVGQFVVKPLLGYLFGTISMTAFGLPTSLAAGIMLTSCVSGAQLSNYATFLTDPPMAPLSIVMTSLSTATAVFVTPFLSLLLIGKKLPVDVKGMVSNIMQIVITPILTGLILNRFFPRICSAIRPFLPPLSVFVTALCVGAPLAINVDSVMSPHGLSVLLLVIAFHASAFISGFAFTGLVFRDLPDVKALQRTLSFETVSNVTFQSLFFVSGHMDGINNSCSPTTGLTSGACRAVFSLANKFFQDPLVSIPPAISTVIMSLMGFSLVLMWAQRKETAAY